MELASAGASPPPRLASEEQLGPQTNSLKHHLAKGTGQFPQVVPPSQAPRDVESASFDIFVFVIWGKGMDTADGKWLQSPVAGVGEALQP